MEKINPIIRLATLEDAGLLAEIGAKSFSDYFAEANTPENMATYLAQAFGEDIQAAELADPDVTYLLAEVDGITAGYAKLHESHPPEGVVGHRPLELVRLYALNGWLGKGIGAALMQACLDLAAGNGYDTLWLGVWEHNPKARVFYHRWGFEDCGTHAFHLGDDVQTDYHMQRPVIR
jgi:GNAT superfamily N-acetyltransferase